nr:hypothetical protein [Tanacetum cinerariifolium]
MAESSSHNPSLPEITLNEEHVTLDKPKSPNPFLPATQVEFTFEEIAFTTNNEVTLLYPSHPNQEYFKDVLDFISKCRLKKVDYAKLIWEDLIHKLNKKTKEKIVAYPRFISLLLEHMMPEYDNEELTINLTQSLSSKEITPQLSFNHLAIPQARFLALGWILEDIHVTWAHLEKKQRRLRTYTKSLRDFMHTVAVDGVAGIKRHRRDLSSDVVRNLANLKRI